VSTGDVEALKSSRERTASTTSGYPILLLMLAVSAVAAFLVYRGVQAHSAILIANTAWIGAVVVLFLACGFYMLQPNQLAAITLFGDYRGTDRSTGLRWVLPWMIRKKISVRANNFISERLKVNDLRGNPIEIAAQIVWRVVDTAQALFDVDDYREFVKVQVEAAVRTVGSRYPYDDFEHMEVTLRGNHDQIGGELRQEIIERLKIAGITVDECGFTHLA
jgi:regulator of protease activity HflC (stomatin/prohibitin superfamily)